MVTAAVSRARLIAETVLDPELPLLTLADLGVLREVSDVDGHVVVTITPTYSGCPAMQTMRDDLQHALGDAGFADAEVRTSLAPAWSTDWITDAGRDKLAAGGIAPPGRAPAPRSGPVPLTLQPIAPAVPCPLCGSRDTVETSRFGATSCKALRRCRSCGEPYEHIKEF